MEAGAVNHARRLVEQFPRRRRSADRLAELLAANGNTLRLATTEALYRVQIEYTCDLLDVVDEVCDETTANLITDAIYGRLSGTGAVEADKRVREARQAMERLLREPSAPIDVADSPALPKPGGNPR
jgi:hypothetical protein